MDLILFDASCLMCNRWVQRIGRRDRERRYVFAPLAGETAAPWKNQLPPDLDSLVLIESYQTQPVISSQGVAVARIGKHLGFPWSWIGTVALWCPHSLINWFYGQVAKRRHALSHEGSCPLMPPEWKDRFLP
jgi:predicted DCC family thiol-disulfide oxidoreductase YuxK